MTDDNDLQFPYIHGFDQKEQQRLRDQARFSEHTLFQEIDFTQVEELLEIGCGVGAQSEILLRRFPQIQLTGIDLNEKQLESAKEYLASLPYAQGRYKLDLMNASELEFQSKTFDAIYMSWVLEHVKEPQKVLTEARRVLRPGGQIIINEVMNFTFFLNPYSPNLWEYWMKFNDFQYDHAGDPFVGAKLGNLLMSVGFKDIQTSIKTWHLDNREPDKRKATIDFWQELLMSGKKTLIERGVVTKELADNAQKELKQVSHDPNAVFFFSFMQAKAYQY